MEPPPTETAKASQLVHLRPVRIATGWLRWVPVIQVVQRYEIGWLWHDLVAGLALTAVLIPVGIAYAVASGLPGICGLYATMTGLLAYALFGH